MGNNEDSDDSDNSDYPDIVSTKWPNDYFKGTKSSRIRFDVNGTYIEPHVDQVLLGTSVKDIFANSKTTIDISQLINRTDLNFDFDILKKTWKISNERYVLINWEKRLAIKESEAKRLTSRNLEKDIPNNKEIVSNDLKTYLEKYNNAYFDKEHFWTIADYTKVGTGEYPYYKLIHNLLSNYFTENKGFLVETQNKQGQGIVDATVTNFDPRSSEAVKPCLGLHGDFEKRDKKDFYHNVNCFIEAKKEHDITSSKNTSWISILGQLKQYHVNSGRNKNAFSIAIRGFEMSFYLYINDWHHSMKFFNKGSDWNGFLCLYLNDEGVQILQQSDTYEPQIITYNMVGGKFNRHRIHTILTWMSSLHGLPKTQGSLILSELESSINPWEHDNKIGYLKDSKILQTLFHNGELNVFNQSK